jgi:capsule polysaccharide modification protein KpsS
MNSLPELFKRLYEARLICYKHHMNGDERGAMIAATFAVDDMMNTYKRYVRDISEDAAMSQVVMEVEDIEGAANGYRNT